MNNIIKVSKSFGVINAADEMADGNPNVWLVAEIVSAAGYYITHHGLYSSKDAAIQAATKWAQKYKEEIES